MLISIYATDLADSALALGSGEENSVWSHQGCHIKGIVRLSHVVTLAVVGTCTVVCDEQGCHSYLSGGVTYECEHVHSVFFVVVFLFDTPVLCSY